MTWNPFKKKEVIVPELAPAVYELASPQVLRVPKISQRKWVVWREQRVGILHLVNDLSTGVVHLVDLSGATVEVIPVNLGELRLARYLEIPETRRPVSQVYAATLGYF